MKAMKLNFSIIFGVIIILTALVLTLSATGVLPYDLRYIIISWQTFILVAGIKIILLRQYLVGMAITLSGIYFILPHIYKTLGLAIPIPQSVLTTLFVASLLIVIGVATMLIGRKWVGINKRQFFGIKTNQDGSSQISCAFSQINHAIIEKPFRGAVLSTIFGELTLNMSKTTLACQDTYLEINNAFGTTKIIVPESWVLNTTMQSFFGEVKDHRNNITLNNDHRLILKGTVAFGSIEIVGAYEDFTPQEDLTSEDVIDTISVRHNNRVHIITLDELQYIKADGDYVTLCTGQGNFLKEQTMKYFHSVLPTDKFIRIHRSYIVNITQISSLDCRGKEVYYVIIKNGTALRTSNTGYQELKKRLEI